MKIGLDARYLVEPRTGIGQYTHELLRGMLAIAPTLSFALFYHVDIAPEWQLHPRTTAHRVRTGRAHLVLSPQERWEQVSLVVALAASRPDLYHATGMVGPIMSPIPVISTVHDLSFMLYPELMEPRMARYWSRWVPISAHRARRVLAVSETTRSDLCRLCDVPDNKVAVIPQGVGEEFEPLQGTKELEHILSLYSLSSPYVLFVGTIQPRKNLARLIQAFLKIRQKWRIPHQLVVCGDWGWLFEDVRRLAAQPEAKGAIRFLGRVPGEHLPYLYSGAEVFAYPSLYEGFGLPILEAMACGTAVLTSNVSGSAEVAGESALLVNPWNVDEIAEGLWLLIDSAGVRSAFVESGLKHVTRFSWRRTAEMTLSVYREAV